MGMLLRRHRARHDEKPVEQPVEPQEPEENEDQDEQSEE